MLIKQKLHSSALIIFKPLYLTYSDNILNLDQNIEPTNQNEKLLVKTLKKQKNKILSTKKLQLYGLF